MLRLMVDEFWRLQRERVGERELADAKAYMTGSFPLTIETPDAIATQVLNVLFYGLPVEELQSFRERVNAVTVDDIERVARFYLRPDRLSIVLVGNAAAFASQLRGVGFGTFETVEHGEPRSDGRGLQASAGGRPEPAAASGGRSGRPDGWRGVRRTAGRADRAPRVQPRGAIAPEDGASARRCSIAVIAAKGGLETLRAVKSITADDARRRCPTPDGPISAETDDLSRSIPIACASRPKLPDATDRPGLRRRRGRGCRIRAARTTCPSAMIRDLEAELPARHHRACCSPPHDGTVRARLLPDVKDDDGQAAPRARAVGRRPRPDGAVHRSRRPA